MKSREIIRRVIEFDNPPRIGYNFNPPGLSDMRGCSVNNQEMLHPFSEWGDYPHLAAQVPWFKGELRLDQLGNIYGRLNKKTKGECIKGYLQDGWEKASKIRGNTEKHLLSPMKGWLQEAKDFRKENPNSFIYGSVLSIQSAIRDLRNIENMLTDVLLEPDALKDLINYFTWIVCEQIEVYSKTGIDAIVMYDDWGTQKSLLISPHHWQEFFKPAYEKVAKAAHEHDMKFMLHSCGYILEAIDSMIDAGIDVLQLDQPDLMGVKLLGERFHNRITFWSVVDIQTKLPTGDRTIIQNEARNMIEFLSEGGGFIAKDYPQYNEINVQEEWANWAREIFCQF